MCYKNDPYNKEIAKALLSFISIIAIVVLMNIFASCSHRIYPPSKIEYVVDTVIRERLVHDTATFVIEKEVERIVTRDTLSHLENDYAKSDASVEGGFLHHSLETKPHTIYVPVSVPVHDTTIVEKKADTIIKEVTIEKKLTWWQRVRLDLFYVLLAFILLSITIAYLKKLL